MYVYLSFAGIYLTVTMGMTSLSIVLTVFVLQLYHVAPRQEPVPNWLRKIMIDYAARLLCMRSHLASYYACAAEEEGDVVKNDVKCLVQTIDYARNPPNDVASDADAMATKGIGVYPSRKYKGSIASGRVQIVVTKDDLENTRHENIVNEWKLVALVMDRFLFVLFLTVSVMSSLGILVFKPLTKPNIVD